MFSRVTNRMLMTKRRYSSRILHITDSEGNGRAFFSAINNSKTVRFNPDKGLSFYDTREIPYFIFGGDTTDRNNNDLALSELLLDFKHRYPEQVFLLVGNRDITKNRIKIELDPVHIKTRLLHCQQPHWLQQPTLPLDYVNKAMKEQKYPGSADDFVNTLSIEQCQLIYLKWMLEKTMGCPHSFRYRQEELKRTYPNSIITEEMVLQSFIKEASPEGINGRYLQQAQAGVIIPNTGVLAVHGGLKPNNIGRIPGMHEQEQSISDAKIWIAKFNNWYKNQIQHWINYSPSDPTKPACTDLDACALPTPGIPKSIITADMLDLDRKFNKIPHEVSQYLKENGINIVLTGHQPCGDHPAILRDEGLLFINGDTGYADFKAHLIDDTRGEATHTLEIIASENEAEIDLQATLYDKTKVRTQLSVQSNTIKGDPFIGSITPEQQLVQCRLSDGQYRLAFQKDFKVDYSLLPESKTRQLIGLKDDEIENNLTSFKGY